MAFEGCCSYAPAQILARIEDEMRRQLHRLARVHVTERTVLLRAFGKVSGRAAKCQGQTLRL